MKDIFIYTGPVKSGKSTSLFEWIETKSDVAGILSLMFEGKKQLYAIARKEMKCLESGAGEPISIGRYNFDNKVFKWAQNQLLSELETNPKLLIVDEIGFLELKGKGLEPAFSTVFKAIGQMEITLLLVVRDSLVDRVIDFYKLDHPKLINDLNALIIN